MIEVLSLLACFASLATALIFARQKTRAERQLRNAIAALPEGISFYDKQDRVYLWNAPYESITGTPSKLLKKHLSFRAMLGEGLAAGVYEEAKGREDAWLEERMALREVREGFREQQLSDGRWLRVADRRTVDGGTVSICMDVTDAKRREDSFKLMFESNPVPMWVWQADEKLSVTDMNQAALQHLGYEKSDIENLTVFDLLSPEEGPALRGMIRAGINKAYYGERMWRPKQKDGTLRYALPYIHILPRSGDKRRFIGAIVDITERVMAEEERRNSEVLTRELEQARLADRMKSEFLATMSHELRTPLNAILGFSEVLRDQVLGPLPSTQYRDYAGDIHNSGSHLLKLINDILDLSKLDAGQMELHREAIDIDHLVADCVHTVQSQADKAGIRLVIETRHRGEVMSADERRMRQMLLNLLSNAIKFTNPGGEVKVSVSHRANGFAIGVSDNGIGIAAENVVRALDRFGQIDSSLSRKYQGTGLGLPLTKELAELHGASLDLQSQLGIGTTVTILFPLTALIAQRDSA